VVLRASDFEDAREVEMSVGRICSREVIVARPGEAVEAAAQRMAGHAVGTLVVVDGDSRPIGILTDRDLVTRVLAHGLDARETPVDAVMTPHPTTISELAPIESALASMRAGRLRRLPVVDDAGRLVGIQSLDDALSLLAEELTIIGGLLEREAEASRRPHPVASPPPSAGPGATEPDRAAAAARTGAALEERFRRALIRRLRRRREEIFARVAQTESEIDALAEERERETVEQGQEEALRDLLARLDDHGRREIAALDQALERLWEGEYARCRTCGRRIPYSRLQAVPTAVLCIDCAAAEEQSRASGPRPGSPG
jgi:CBS domain-containing protein/RNA polymerase-binding transcription factor DksA